MNPKQTWQRRVESMVEYNEEHNLSCRDLAEQLNISKSQASTDLTLGYALRVYNELEEVANYTDALKFVKDKNFNRHGN